MTQSEFQNLVPMMDKVQNIDAINNNVSVFYYGGPICNWSTGDDWCFLVGINTNNAVVLRNDLITDFELCN